MLPRVVICRVLLRSRLHAYGPALLALGVGLAMGRLELARLFTPGGLALYLVVLVTGLLPTTATGLGVVIGTALSGAPWPWALWRAGSVLLTILMAAWLVRRRGAKAIRSRIGLWAALCRLVGGWWVFLYCITASRSPDLAGPSLRTAALALGAVLVEAALCGVAADLLLDGARALGGRSGGNAASPAPLMLAALVVAGIKGIGFLGLRLDYLAAAALTLAGAMSAGVAGGAATATAAGLALALVRPQDLDVAVGVAYAAGGLAAGGCRPLGRLGSGLAFLFGLLGVMSWQREPGGALQASLLVAGTVAVAVAVATPPRWLASVGAAFANLAWDEPPPPPDEVPARRLHQVAGVLREVGRAFDQAAPAQRDGVEQALTRPLEEVQQRICTGCSMYRTCWEGEFYRTVQVLEDVWSRIEEQGRINHRQVPDRLQSYCIYPGIVLTTLNDLNEMEQARRFWERRLADGRELVGEYMQGIAAILERTGAELAPAPGASAPVLVRVRWGMARLPKRGSIVSGDSVLAEPLPDNRYLLLLSDGMGTGSQASIESKFAVQLLRQVLAAGFSSQVAVQTVNAALLMRSTRDSFTTIDLAVLDLTQARVEFVKTGAVSSFLRRGTEVKPVRGSSPPAGILHWLSTEPQARPVLPGDVLVMVTDGLWEQGAQDQEHWLLQHLYRTDETDPELLAEEILGCALRDREPEDDMTVLVARIDKAVPGTTQLPLGPEVQLARRAPNPGQSRQ